MPDNSITQLGRAAAAVAAEDHYHSQHFQQTVCQLLELTSELTSSEDVLPSSSSFSLSFSIRPRGPGAKTMAVVAVDFV